jgi:cytochrome c oxidase subunit 4
MSTEAAGQVEVAPGELLVDDLEGGHVSDSHYVKVAIALALLTGFELAMSYGGLEGIYLVAPLLIVMMIKFVIVGAHFMHLKYDPVVLKRIFYTGLILAIFVYTIALLTFGIFGFQ